jgi:hypothetical protein
VTAYGYDAKFYKFSEKEKTQVLSQFFPAFDSAETTEVLK